MNTERMLHNIFWRTIWIAALFVLIFVLFLALVLAIYGIRIQSWGTLIVGPFICALLAAAAYEVARSAWWKL